MKYCVCGMVHIKDPLLFYLTTHSTHFIYGYMVSDIWLRTILIVRKETRCRHIGYSYRLTARVLLHAPSHRQDNTYHGLCYTSRGALAGTRNSSMRPTHEGSIRRPIAPWANALPLSYVPLLLYLSPQITEDHLSFIYIYVYILCQQQILMHEIRLKQATHTVHSFLGLFQLFYLINYCFVSFCSADSKRNQLQDHGKLCRAKKWWFTLSHHIHTVSAHHSGAKWSYSVLQRSSCSSKCQFVLYNIKASSKHWRLIYSIKYLRVVMNFKSSLLPFYLLSTCMLQY